MTRQTLAEARRQAEQALAAFDASELPRDTYAIELEFCLRALLDATAPKANPIDLTALPVHFVALLPRGRIFMHPETPISGVLDPWPLQPPEPRLPQEDE